MKKLTSIVLAIMMLLPVVGVRAEAETETRSLTVGQAVELAIQNSNQLRIYQRDVEASRVGWREADDAHRNAGRINIAQPNTALLNEGYYVRQAEMNQRLAEMTLRDFKTQLELQVTTEYYGLKSAIDTSERAHVARQYANENLWTVNQKLLQGTATALDSMQAATNMLRANGDREAALRNVEQARRTLNVTLGLPIDTMLELTDVLPVAVADLPQPDDIMERALANRMDVVQARESADLAAFALEVYEKYIPAHMFAFQQQEITTATALERRDITVANATLAIYKMYNDILSAEANVRVARETMEQSNQLYTVAIARYDMGMIHSSELLNALVSWKDAMMGYENAKLSYATAVANYESLL